MGYLQWSSEAVPVKNKRMCAVFSCSANPDADCQAHLLLGVLTLLSHSFAGMEGYIYVKWVFCCWLKQLPACATEGSAPVTHRAHRHSNTDYCFFSPILSSSGCVYNISVVIIRYLGRVIWCAQRSIKRLCLDLSCCLTVCNSTEVITQNVREPRDLFSLSLYRALK